MKGMVGMAEMDTNTGFVDPKEEMKKLKEQKKLFQKEQKEQRKEAKKKAKELEEQEREIDEELEGGNASVAIVSVFIILIWIGILCLLIKLDVGGFGSNVLTPILKDVPVINKILPAENATESRDGAAYGGYNSLKDAVEQIKNLELELEQAQSANATYAEQIDALKTEVERLKTFEDNQVEFQKIKTEFYKEVVYADKGPGEEAYQKYYESMDPATAEALYKQVAQTSVEDGSVRELASTFTNMKPTQAAKILEAMTDNLDLAARILKSIDVQNRGAILAAMDADVAARVTKIMEN